MKKSIIAWPYFELIFSIWVQISDRWVYGDSRNSRNWWYLITMITVTRIIWITTSNCARYLHIRGHWWINFQFYLLNNSIYTCLEGILQHLNLNYNYIIIELSMKWKHFIFQQKNSKDIFSSYRIIYLKVWFS